MSPNVAWRSIVLAWGKLAVLIVAALLAGLVLLLGLADGARAGEEEPDPWAALCAKVKDLPILPEDRLTDAHRAQLACPEFGGPIWLTVYQDHPLRKPDFRQARLCALRGLEGRGDFPIISAEIVLTTLYANGLGGRRDLRLAEKFACQEWEWPSVREYLLRKLEERRTASGKAASAPLNLKYYDGGMRWITAYEEVQLEDAQARAHLQYLKKMTDWSAPERAAWEALDKIAFAYIRSHVENEAYHGGTIKYLEMMSETDVAFSRHRALTFELQHLPLTGDAADFAKADASLNRLYREMIAHPPKVFPGNPEDDHVFKADDIKETELAWLKLREAWVAYLALRRPDLAAETVRTWQTLDRIEVLKSLQRGTPLYGWLSPW